MGARWLSCAALTVTLLGCAGSPEPVALQVSQRANATPSIAASGNFVSVVWGASTDAGVTDVLIGRTESESEPTLAMFYAMSPDGRRFTPRQQLPTQGVPRHPQIAIATGGGVVVAWDEGSNGARGVAVAHGQPDAAGRVVFQRQVASSPSPATYPVVAAADDVTLAAWTAGGAGESIIRVTRLRLNER